MIWGRGKAIGEILSEEDSYKIYIIKVVKKMDYTSVFIVINYFCLGNTQRIIYLAHGICLEMKENYVVPLIR